MNYKIKLAITLIISFFVLLLFGVLQEISKPSWCKYKEYRIEVYYTDGNSDIINYTLPENIHFQTNVYHCKGKTEDLFQYVDTDLLFGGHWTTLGHNVKSFKLLN